MNLQVWGHRGCRGAVNPPENSLSAFQCAIDCGAGGIELDVHLSKDGQLAVFHDTTLERMTGTIGEVGAFTLAELKKLRLLHADGRPGKETIPTLDEVLNLVDRDRRAAGFTVNIELKGPSCAQAVAIVLRKCRAEGWLPTNFLISSFDMSGLREMKALVPEVPIGTLFHCSGEELARRIGDSADIQPDTINIPLPSLTPAALGLINAAGAKAVVWTPSETNPSVLSQAEREQLAKRLREREFAMITDFPKDVLQLLKPNLARATATGVLAAYLAYEEHDMLFQPSESGLEDIKPPSDYPELKRFGFAELQLIASDGIAFTVWERKGGFDRPDYLLFHGNRAHWGDTGPGDSQRDRRARLKFIEELAASGAGVTAVTLRGFGRSTAIPSEDGFMRDINAITEHLFKQGVDHRKLAIAGESLGTWAATQAAVEMTRQNRPPALLSLQNPFTCVADVGERVISHFPIVRSLNIALSASTLNRHVLKNHFYTARLFAELSPQTSVQIATSGKDDLIHPSHSQKLAEIAQERGLRITRELFPEAFHHNIPPAEFARSVARLAVEECHTSDCSPLWGGPPRALALDALMPYL
jgi:glycerophosphoryl diester phosphodiesterase